MVDCPAAFRAMKPFLARAEELDNSPNDEPKVVAYYCRQYAMERGLEIRTTDPTVDPSYLVTLMTRLEADKPGLPAGTTKESAKVTATDFANEIFNKADQEDRAGFADKNTARSFYAASIFYEILKQFGDCDGEVDTKRVYSKWKSADIVKAIREGRRPTSGGPNEPAQAGAVAVVGGGASHPPMHPSAPPLDLHITHELPPAAPTGSPSQPLSQSQQQGGGAHAAGYTHIPSNQPPQGLPPGTQRPQHIGDAIELAKYAVRALEEGNSFLGARYLRQALEAAEGAR